MRSFIRVSAAVFALLVATNIAGAQGGGGGGGGGARGGQGGGMGRGGAGQVTALMKDITLTEAQNKTVAEAVTWFDAETGKQTRPAQGDSAAMAKFTADRAKLTADFRAKLKAVLTPDQQKTFDANVAAMPAGGRGRRGGGH